MRSRSTSASSRTRRRLYLEEASQESGIRSLCAINGTCAGGGYELAMACDELVLIEDGNSTVGLPEVPLLGVLPGTGGLTRVTDKRKVRRDRADVFSTLTEGIKGKRAVQWGLVDAVVPRSRFDETVVKRAGELVADAKVAHPNRGGEGIQLHPLTSEDTDDSWQYQWVKVTFDRSQRTAEIRVKAPTEGPAADPEALHAQGSDAWALKAFRELDDALLRLRFNEDGIGLFTVATEGDPDQVLAHDAALLRMWEEGSWLAREILLQMKRTLKRLELSARTTFAIVDEGTCFAGSLFELALAADRIYMLDQEGVSIRLSPANFGPFPMSNGLTRLQTRFWGRTDELEAVMGAEGPLDAEAADELGLVTATPDDIDWEDEIRLAVEERASISPDALTGMEANLRFPGPETMETKIFARLSAWQNWIFQRPNAVGERGALTVYGQPERPHFDWRRT